MSDWFDEFLVAARRRNVKASTLHNYQMMIQSLRDKNGLRLPQDAESKDILRSKLDKLQSNYAPYYYQQLIVMIRGIFKQQERLDLLKMLGIKI